jgi:NTE family protein
MTENYHFRNLVFEGGGVKGVAYVGALKELEKRDILANIERIGGTSAGAINAVLLAAGYTPTETTKILFGLDFRNFLDDNWGVIRDTKRLIEQFGWYKGDFFRNWIGNLIHDKIGNANATFNDFRNAGLRDLYLVGTNISTGFSEVMSAEHTPRMPVADAARISMSIPLFFRAIRNVRHDVYVDGGVLKNYPIKLFDREKYIEESRRAKHALEVSYYAKDNKSKPDSSSKYVFNKETLGFRLDTKEEIAMFRDGAEPPASDIDDFFDYTIALIKTVMNAQNNNHLHSDNWQRTIYIDTLGVGTVDFDLSETMKRKLIKSGADGTIKYFDWWDTATGKKRPRNHPKFVAPS